MKLFNSLHYLATSLRFPGRADFARGGFGILERYQRCRKYWDPHLTLCRAFIEQALRSGPPAPAVLVLGAGRLLDVPLGALRSGSKVTLLDADPSVLPTWKKAKRLLSNHGIECSFRIGDLSGRLDPWTAALQDFSAGAQGKRRSEEEAAAFLRNLCSETGLAPPSACALLGAKNADLVISLNLLSQIPLYWEDRVRSLWSRLASGPENKFGARLEEALLETMRALIKEHFGLLENSEAPELIIISDQLFHYYHPDKSAFRTEEALGGLTLAPFGRYSAISTERWWWHLAPQHLENQDYGEIHDVMALHLRRGNDNSALTT